LDDEKKGGGGGFAWLKGIAIFPFFLRSGMNMCAKISLHTTHFCTEFVSDNIIGYLYYFEFENGTLVENVST
jgi:hypothetical protein